VTYLQENRFGVRRQEVSSRAAEQATGQRAIYRERNVFETGELVVWRMFLGTLGSWDDCGYGADLSLKQGHSERRDSFFSGGWTAKATEREF